MAHRIPHLLLTALVAATATGCASTAARFYTLDATAKAGEAPAVRCAVVVGPVSVPASVDRPQIVVQVAPNRVDIDEFHRWATPLYDGIARVVASDLSVLLGTPDVGTALVSNSGPTYRVTIDIQRFESVQDQAVLIEALWSVRGPAAGAVRPGHTLAREAVQGTGYEALAAAHSRALAQLSGEIAETIRATATP